MPFSVTLLFGIREGIEFSPTPFLPSQPLSLDSRVSCASDLKHGRRAIRSRLPPKAGGWRASERKRERDANIAHVALPNRGARVALIISVIARGVCNRAVAFTARCADRSPIRRRRGASFFPLPPCENWKTLGFKNDTRRRGHTCNAPSHTRARRTAAVNGRKCGVCLEIGPCAAVIGDPFLAYRMAGRVHGNDATTSFVASIASRVAGNFLCTGLAYTFPSHMQICDLIEMSNRLNLLHFAWLRVYHINIVSCLSCVCVCVCVYIYIYI